MPTGIETHKTYKAHAYFVQFYFAVINDSLPPGVLVLSLFLHFDLKIVPVFFSSRSNKKIRKIIKHTGVGSSGPQMMNERK